MNMWLDTVLLHEYLPEYSTVISGYNEQKGMEYGRERSNLHRM